MAKSKTENVRLPKEMIIEILLRLPVKSIGQFRCVSKQWLYLLEDPQFINDHLTLYSQKQQDKLIIVDEDHFFNTITFNHNEIAVKKIYFDRKYFELPDNWIAIDGSCNGLVLVEDDEKVQFLINPTTLEHYTIPKNDLSLPLPGSFYTYGLGYDVVSDDYKVVCLSHYDTENGYGADIGYTFVDVHSVKKRIWRRLEPSPYDHSIPGLAPGVLLNGALHWLAGKTSERRCVIAAFDLNAEKFSEMTLPAALTKGKFMFNKLAVLRGCLCVLANTRKYRFNIWMMKDYGVEKSWTKYIIKGSVHHDNYVTPVYLTSGDDLVLDGDGELVAYSMREKQWSYLVVTPAMFENAGTATFRESLVSPIFDDEGSQG